ncbi:septal ring lytic transglycosylase RlpA family protein [Roseicella frigidaeris]|uniref:Endolytic peptidoglycan transglycosylase RlpA n=1 Tax=Roseicella frigidaeris TaxID=2230885 RepID=A0A327LXJ8_9PROT|nr:septal ring lytic transglycosylase RlpA family protein [Roseicella frigidaeris]RAI55399.1 septal ring lytic transglycosylase RlpA family lipoprotein [Roseicella frigidaeris]
MTRNAGRSLPRLLPRAAAAACLALALAAPGLAPGPAAAAERHAAGKPAKVAPQRGKASYYAPKFNGKKMANGARFNPNSNSAAHKTLPLGTTARVTNLENGRTAEVKIEDRGPYKPGRVIDVSPKTAERLDMKKDGTAPVVVQPVQVPAQDQRVAAQ